MKIQRPAAVALTISGVLLVANLLSATVSPNQYVTNYPAVVCPPNSQGLLTAISLSSTKTQFRLVGSSATKMRVVKMRRYNETSSSAIIDSKEMTPAVWQVQSGVWAGATICKTPTSSQWFVGGASDVTSRGDLLLVNSGLSPAIADISIWNEVSAQPDKVITIKPNSQVSVGLDALAPGSKEIVMKVISRAGRLSAFMIDQRGKGLRSLGGDIVNAAENPSKNIYIPAIPHTIKKSGKKTAVLSHSIRILNSSDVDTRVSIQILSSDGSFIPVGLVDREIPKGRVVAIPLNPEINANRFGLRITSEQPIVAGVFSPTVMKGKSDFIWSTASPELSPFGLSLTGLSPELIFTGSTISVGLEITYNNGKKKSVEINGADFVGFQVPQDVRSVQFSRVSKDTYGAALMSTPSGSGYFPLEPGSVLTKSAVPTSSIQVLTP
jgi:hypothetical protein